MSPLLSTATLATAGACSLMAGLFFVFSTFAMGGLGRLPDAQGVAAMQAINRDAQSSLLFLVVFGGAAVACIGLTVVAAITWGEPWAPWLVGGAVAYLVGVIGLTVGYHIPLNDGLAAVDPQAADAGARWARYRADWVPWNSVRAAAALAAAALLTVGVVVS